MINGTIYALRDHLPSALIVEFFNQIKVGVTGLSISVETVEYNNHLKQVIRKTRLKDLPALKLDGDGTIYYRGEIEKKLRRLVNDERQKEKRKGQNYALRTKKRRDISPVRSRRDHKVKGVSKKSDN